MSDIDRLLSDGMGARDAAERRQETFEERIVKGLLQRAGIATPLWQLRHAAEEVYGIKSLNFRWFRQEYPRFPLILGASKIPNTAGITLADALTGSFSKLPFFREYSKFLASEDIDDYERSVAFFFNLGGRTFALHNYRPMAAPGDDPDVLGERCGRLVRPFGNPVIYYIIEKASDLLDRLPTDWAS